MNTHRDSRTPETIIRPSPWADHVVSQPSDSQLVTKIQNEEARLKALISQRLGTCNVEQSTDVIDERSVNLKPTLTRWLPGAFAGEAAAYTRLPVRRQISDCFAEKFVWRIELHGLAKSGPPIGIDLAGDVVLGRGPNADFDLEPFHGTENAVSRRHALLRPSKRQIHLIDLGSTNGTLANAIPLTSSASHVLQDNDLISFGLLTFTLKIVSGPPGSEEQPDERRITGARAFGNDAHQYATL